MGECTGAYNLETPAAALSLCNAPKCVEGWGFSRCAFPLRLPPSWSCTRLPRCQETSMQSLGAQPSSTQSSSAYNRQGYRFAQTHTHTHICLCVSMYIYMYMCICTCTCPCTCVCTCICTGRGTCTCTCTCLCFMFMYCLCIHTYIYTYNI